MGDMGRFALLVLIIASAILPARVYASSPQAYADYQYQYDQYRQRLSDFQSAYTQYKQFNSLTSQQDAIDKAKLLLNQRNQVSRAYFLFLTEKLNEDPGLGTTESQPYRTAIVNQIGFLDGNSARAAAAGSLDDVSAVSALFVKNFFAMQLTYRQTIIGLELGYLQFFLSRFDADASTAQSLITASRGDASPEKIAVLDRWLVNLSNKHSVITQKISTIRTASSKISGDIQEQDRQFTAIQSQFAGAQQDLTEAVSYLGEVVNSLQYE